MVTNEFKGKKLLILGGVKLACDIVKRAQSMGAYVEVADYNTDSPAKAIADKGVLIDATNVDALVEYCKTEGINGITTGFVDILLPICRQVCDKLALPYYATEKMISMSTNKIDFKDTCAKYGIPTPKTYLIGSELTEDILASVHYPVFVKPMDASGSRGAGVCGSEEELRRQLAEAISYSASGNAIIEDYLTGTEFLLDYIGVNGEFRLLSMFDRYMCDDRASAVNYSNICLCPAKKIDNYYASVNDKIVAMFKDLGFRDGLIFLQGYTDGEKITFYEMGCRLGGSFYNLEQRCLGLDPVEMTVRFALSGKMLDSIEAISKTSAKFDKTAMVLNYLLKGENGTIDKITGLDEIEKLNGFTAAIIHRGPGFHYEKDRTVDKPAVSLYLTADSPEEAKKTLGFANSVIDVINAEGDSLLMQKYSPDKL